MSARRTQTLVAATKLGVFSVVALVVTGVLVAIMGRFGSGETEEYSAIFASASLLQEGDDVRVAGVVLGKVQEVEVVHEDRARVRFTVADDLPLTRATRVEIRYLNLVGDRYVTLTQGEPDAEPLKPGATIPMSNTSPALNLTALYNGFAPLFSALEPEDVNKLSLNLVKVLQGEGGTVEGLMRHTASLTNAIADRDELVGQVITNLDELLRTVDGRHQQLTTLVQELRRWVGGLAEDRVRIGRSIVNISDMTRVLADLITEARPPLKRDITQLRRLTTQLDQPDTRAVLRKIMDNLPEMLADQTRTGTYGSWYSYYLCGAAMNIKLPDEISALEELSDLVYELKRIQVQSTAPRCDLE
jgi:phospholipid/cholesterol/gamma-HCH transport system substrate-binding protein